jgi:signal transduction histidine kinase
MFRIAQFDAGSLTVQVASPLKSVGRLYRSYFNVALVMLAMVLVLSIFLGMWLNRLALAPIRRIQRTAARISADNLSERIPVVDGDDEITGLARLLNQMFDRLERSFFQLWRFAGNASHELKTPLSIIRLQSEKLLMHGNLAPGQQESVQQQLESIARLSTVIEKLLFLAKSEVGAIDMNLVEQSTGNLVKAFSEDALVLCEEGRVQFVIARNTEITATFDAALLRQVLLNLLSNALRATPAGGEIILSSWEQHQQWVVTLEDTGPGLPASKLEEVFEPFVRVHGADSGLEGSGLGLAICRSILSLHHGQIYGANRQPGPGFCITLEIPLTRPVQSLSGTPRMSSASHSSGGSSAADAGNFVRRQPSPAQNNVP